MTFIMKKTILASIAAIFAMTMAAPVFADSPKDEDAAEETERLPTFLEFDREQLMRGQIVQVDTRQVQRIVVDETEVLEVRMWRDGSRFTLRGVSPGETEVEVTFADDSLHNFTVEVGTEVIGLSGEVTIEPGEIHALNAVGVHRVQTDHESVIDISPSKDGQTILIEGLVAGEALVYLHIDDRDAPKALRFLVEAK